MVRGLDATAAQSFGSLRNLLRRLNVELIIVELENASASALLTAHGVIGLSGCRCGIPKACVMYIQRHVPSRYLNS